MREANLDILKYLKHKRKTLEFEMGVNSAIVTEICFDLPEDLYALYSIYAGRAVIMMFPLYVVL